MERKKETKTYRFDSEVIEHADTNPLIPSFAEWAAEAYRREFMEVETLAAKMQTYYNMAEDCRERLGLLKEEQKKGQDLTILKPNELAWIRYEAPMRIKKSTFEGVYKAFCNQFGRHDINRKQFKLMVGRFELDGSEKV